MQRVDCWDTMPYMPTVIRQDNPMEMELLTRCGSHFTTTIVVKHVLLLCFGVDPCGTAKNTVEGKGMPEHCKESTNEIVVKKGYGVRKKTY